MPHYVYHRNRGRSLERDPSWSLRHYAPVRLPVVALTKAGKAERSRPPSAPKKGK